MPLAPLDLRITSAVAALVAKAPPLTSEQSSRLAVLLKIS